MPVKYAVFLPNVLNVKRIMPCKMENVKFSVNNNISLKMEPAINNRNLAVNYINIQPKIAQNVNHLLYYRKVNV